MEATRKLKLPRQYKIVSPSSIIKFVFSFSIRFYWQVLGNNQ